MDEPGDQKQELSITGGYSLSTNNDRSDVLVSINMPDSQDRLPVDICCVVDVSGSMSKAATLQTESGSQENDGLSILDITTHAVKTVLNCMNENDRLALVVYASQARQVFPLTAMDDDGKKMATDMIDTLRPEDNTNLWGGLHQGLETLRLAAEEDPSRISCVVLLTDGLPNVVPPRGHIPMLQKYRDENPFSCTIHTFGFGYSLDSELLHDIAVEGNGMYSFIPDSGFVGTAFVNILSNIMVTMAKDVVISVEACNGCTIAENDVMGNHLTTYTMWGCQINVGSLQYGQSKDLIIRVTIPEELINSNEEILHVRVGGYSSENQAPFVIEGSIQHAGDAKEISSHVARLKSVETILQAVGIARAGNIENAGHLLGSLIEDIKVDHDPLQEEDLLKDLEGQVTEALSQADYFTRWGKHYLPSLMRAHLMQQCNNFKDPGVQHYGGILYGTLRDAADDVFLSLPPPKPSNVGRRGNLQASRGPVQMARYHNFNNPCVSGQCTVLMADGKTKRVDQLKKNDLVHAGHASGRVLCVVKTYCSNSESEMVDLGNGLQITPYHPIIDSSTQKWCFPSSITSSKIVPCEAVYSFVLDRGHKMTINGITCVTLGHGFVDDVVQHDFFGKESVIEDLSRMKGWNVGLIAFQPNCVVRDKLSGCAVSFDETREVSTE